MNGIMTAGTVAVLITAAELDVRKGKIPNALLISLLALQTGSEIISIFVLHAPIYSGRELMSKVVTSVLIIICLYPFYLVNGLGAGDIKLISVVSISVKEPLNLLLAVFGIATIMALINLGIERIGKKHKRKRTIHLAVPILVAYLLTVYTGM